MSCSFPFAIFLAVAALSPLASRAGFGASCSLQGRIEQDSIIPGESLSVQVDGTGGSHMGETAYVGSTGDFTVDIPRTGALFLRVFNSRGQIIHQEALSGACQSMIQIRIPSTKRERPPSGVVSVSELTRKINPDAVKQYEKGDEALRKQDFSKAESHFRRALEIDPSFVKAYTAMGICYAARADRENAVLEYQKALSIQDDYIPARINLAAELWNLRRYKEAEESARMALKSDPTMDKARLVLGFSLAAQGNRQEALTHFESVVSTEPQARLGLAEILARQGSNAEAIEQLKRYLESGQVKNEKMVKDWMAKLETQLAAAR